MSWAALVKSTPAPEEGAGNETQQTQQKATAPAAGAPKTQAVVDSNAIMKGLRLESVADQLVTVQEVINEVRDKQSRAFLASLPFGIDVKEPTEDSLKAGAAGSTMWLSVPACCSSEQSLAVPFATAVTAFARATGDIHALSKTDLKLLALVHTLEVAAHGSAHIRTSPAQALVKPRHRSNAGKGLPGWGKVANPEDWKVVDEAPEVMGQQGRRRL
jgi:RNA-binding protein NOB1